MFCFHTLAVESDSMRLNHLPDCLSSVISKLNTLSMLLDDALFVVAEDGKEDNSAMSNDSEFIDATIDIQHFSKFLSGNQVNPQNVLLSTFL